MLGEHKRKVLSNGLRVLGVENPALHSFVCSVCVRVGPRFEAPEQVGLSHFLEHMMIQGSENFPTSHAVMRSVEDLGGVIDAGTYAEYINVVLAAHRKHWPRLMDIAGDVLLRPLFDEAEIEQEKLIVAQEISRHRDKDQRNISASELAYCALFRDRVDEAGTRGSRAIMARFDRAAVQEHYRASFTPQNMVVCLAGGLDFGEVLGHVEEYFGGMETGGGPPGRAVPPAADRHEGARALYRTTEALPTAEVLLCHRAYALGDRRFDSARAAAHLLGGGLSSRLFTRVREELGLVYDVSSHVQGFSDGGISQVVLTVGVENLVEAVAAALDVMKEVTAGGFTAAELERYKEGVRCGVEMLCDRPSPLADWYGKQELLLGAEGVVTPEEYVRRQEALTLDALHAAGKELLVPGGSVLVVVGPYDEECRSALRELFPAQEVEVLPAPQ